MANQVQAVNGLTLAKIQAVNGLTDANIQAVNGLEMVGTVDPSKVSITNDLVNSGRSFGNNICYGTHLTDGTAQKQLFVTYGDAGNSRYPTVRVGTVSGDTITWGTEVELDDGGSSSHTEGVYNEEEKRFMCHFHSSSGNNDHKAIGGSITDKSVGSLGTVADVEAGGSGYNQAVNSNIAVYNPTSDTMDCIYEYGDDASDGNHIRSVCFTDTDTNNNLTVGSRVEFVNSNQEFMGIDYNSQRSRTVVVYNDGSSTVKARVIIHGATKTGSISDRNTITLGTEATFSTSSSLTIAEYYGGRNICWNPDQNVHHVILDDNGTARIVHFSVDASNGVSWDTTNKATVSSGTASGNNTGGGVVYNHARDRLISYGATSTAVGSQYNFEYHSYNGSTYTSQGSATTLSTLNGHHRGCGTTKTDTSGIHNGSFMVNHIYDGSDDGDGCRIYCMDPGV
tara:strand:+ start:82 stop:1437 length:1356 start_codon:yes stop_codon:yes gene_type:complete